MFQPPHAEKCVICTNSVDVIVFQPPQTEKCVICTNSVDVIVFQPPQTEKCVICTKSVYAAERMEAGGNIFHKLCFKCCECKMNLTYVSSSNAASAR